MSGACDPRPLKIKKLRVPVVGRVTRQPEEGLGDHWAGNPTMPVGFNPLYARRNLWVDVMCAITSL